MCLKTVESTFIVKGYKKGYKGRNAYYITKPQPKQERYNVYQVGYHLHEHITATDIKSILSNLKGVDDSDVLVSIPSEPCQCFLRLYDVGVLEMNGFRMGFDREEILIS